MLRSRTTSSSARGIHHLSSSRVPLKHDRKHRRHRNNKNSNGNLISLAVFITGAIFLLTVGLPSFSSSNESSTGSIEIGRKSLRKSNVIEKTSLPDDSIYNLAFPTINTEDDMFSLSNLAGRVAILINVACA